MKSDIERAGTPAVAVQRLVRHLPVRTTFINDDGDLCTISITDPCAVINLYGDRPLVEIFAGTGERTDCEQFASMADVGSALMRVKNGGKLKMPNDSSSPTAGGGGGGAQPKESNEK